MSSQRDLSAKKRDKQRTIWLTPSVRLAPVGVLRNHIRSGPKKDANGFDVSIALGLLLFAQHSHMDEDFVDVKGQDLPRRAGA